LAAQNCKCSLSPYLRHHPESRPHTATSGRTSRH